MTKPKLEPCPWCQQIPDLYESRGFNFIDCRNDWCNVQPSTKSCVSGKEAMEIWNKRVLPTHPPELSGNTGELKQTEETPNTNQILMKTKLVDKPNDGNKIDPDPEGSFNKAYTEEFSRLLKENEDYRKALEKVLLIVSGQSEHDDVGDALIDAEEIARSALAMAKEARNE